MKPYAELLEFNQPNPIRIPGFTRIRDAFPGLGDWLSGPDGSVHGYSDPERIMEFAGRWDYGENNARKLGETVKVYTENKNGVPVMEQDVPIIQKYIGMGHESMIEMGDATFFIECSRVVSHELVRHRIASYQQESQRFVRYLDEDDDIWYSPDSMGIKEQEADWNAYDEMSSAWVTAWKTYQSLLAKGVPKQIARYVLPNAMRTRLIMKTNIREWRHVIRLRLDKSAQPEMQELMQQVYDQLVMVFPNALHGVLDNGRGVR